MLRDAPRNASLDSWIPRLRSLGERPRLARCSARLGKSFGEDRTDAGEKLFIGVLGIGGDQDGFASRRRRNADVVDQAILFGAGAGLVAPLPSRRQACVQTI